MIHLTRLAPLCARASSPLRLASTPGTFSAVSRRNASSGAGNAESPEPLSSRWLSDLKARLARIEASSPDKAARAKDLSQDINARWLDLLAGPDGFISSPEWRAIDRRDIIWGDIDSMSSQGHVNNLVYNRLAEAGRVNWARLHGKGASTDEARRWNELITPLSVGLILQNINTTFKFPMNFPDSSTVLFRIRNRPDFAMENLDLEAVIYSDTHQRLAARIIESNAIYDYRVAKKTTLPGFMVEKFQDTFDKQVEAKRHFDGEARGLIRAVQELESGSG